MKITPSSENFTHIVEFEPIQLLNVHEAPIAVNAIAARNAANFGVQSQSKLVSRVIFKQATQELREVDAYQIVGQMQMSMGEKALEGLLLKSIRISATPKLLDFLHGCLESYIRLTTEQVDREPRNTMGNLSGMTRTAEVFVAEDMMQVIAESGVELTPIQAETHHRHVGFGWTPQEFRVDP